MIEIQDLHKTLGEKKILNGVNLQFEKGKTTVIIGGSGCGKSVMLKHIIGILKPDQGRILINGQDIASFDEQKFNSLLLKIGMVFQGGALFDSLTVGENVGFALIEHLHLPKAMVEHRVRESLSMVGLSGVERLMPAELSGGMKKRVALARAVCIRPELIIYDEPTTGVDPIVADIVNDLIINLHDILNITSIAVTHDMKSAYKIASKIAMLYQGKIIAVGTPNEIRTTKDPFVHQFINGLSTGPITDSVKKGNERRGKVRVSG